MGINKIYWFCFVQRIYPPNFIHVGAIPVRYCIEITNHHGVLLGISFLLLSLANSHGDFILSGEAFPKGKINPYFTSNLGEKFLWGYKLHFINIIGINYLCHTSLGICSKIKIYPQTWYSITRLNTTQVTVTRGSIIILFIIFFSNIYVTNKNLLP